LEDLPLYSKPVWAVDQFACESRGRSHFPYPREYTVLIWQFTAQGHLLPKNGGRNNHGHNTHVDWWRQQQSVQSQRLVANWGTSAR
jgi:hypothetical protein